MPRGAGIGVVRCRPTANGKAAGAQAFGRLTTNGGKVNGLTQDVKGTDMAGDTIPVRLVCGKVAGKDLGEVPIGTGIGAAPAHGLAGNIADAGQDAVNGLCLFIGYLCSHAISFPYLFSRPRPAI